MTDTVDSLESWFGDYRDVLKAEGHDVVGQTCMKCWKEAYALTVTGGNLSDTYFRIVRKHKERAVREHVKRAKERAA